MRQFKRAIILFMLALPGCASLTEEQKRGIFKLPTPDVGNAAVATLGDEVSAATGTEDGGISGKHHGVKFFEDFWNNLWWDL